MAGVLCLSPLPSYCQIILRVAGSKMTIDPGFQKSAMMTYSSSTVGKASDGYLFDIRRSYRSPTCGSPAIASITPPDMGQGLILRMGVSSSL